MDQYAVMGNPVSHSKSPQIHAAFAAQTGQAMSYRAIPVADGDFERAVQDFFAKGGKGLNITVPFKQQAWALARKHSPEAARAGAVNTLLFEDGVLSGHNTDGIGLVRDIIANHQGRIADKRLLILGAGGAARGILLPLLSEHPQRITLANRTPARALCLVQEFSDYEGLSACGFDALPGMVFDWVINATAASLQGDLPPLPEGLLSSHAWCYDLMYAQQQTVFCRWATQAGAEQSLDGLGMLVEQAAEAFYLWRGTRPETAPVIASLRASQQ
ncbi:MAG: shikimate dehydrogenase [Pseudomonadales bacterium]|nr:shikimate dehydrogenase [Pseudomonadales bacterium]